MVVSIFVGVIAALLVVLSTKERMRNRLLRKKWDVIGESKSSQLSESLAGLVGTAGGIYLSLEMLTTFLEIEIPSRISFSAISLEPIAAISFVLAIFSPYINRLVTAIKR